MRFAQRYETIDEFEEGLENNFFTYFIDVEDNLHRTEEVYKRFQQQHPLVDQLLTERMTAAHITASKLRLRNYEDKFKRFTRPARHLERVRGQPETLRLGFTAYKLMQAIAESNPELNKPKYHASSHANLSQRQEEQRAQRREQYLLVQSRE